MLTRERIKEILSRSVWRTTRAEMAELLRLALVGFDAENAGSGAADASGGVCEECDDGYVIVTVGAGKWRVPVECLACNGTGRKGGTDA